MKILLTGGGSGGHFYPLIAIAEEINNIVKENRLVKPELFYMSTEAYNEGLLFEHSLQFVQISTGKIRRNLSPQNIILNILDLFRTFFGMILAVIEMFSIYPDVVFGKGGYATFPAIFAARILGIPVILHESDSEPGLVNRWAGKFAQKIALSYPTAAEFFPAGKTAYTGNPVRKEIQDPLTTESHKLLGLEPDIPTIFVLGGSQGSKAINNILMDALPDLVAKYQIIHQTGKNNFKVIGETAEVVLLKNPNRDHYKAFDYLNVLQMRASSGIADLVVSRAGSTIFEIALWGKPSIIIPIPETVSHDQRSNAYAYARSGACEVIEEKNLTHHLLVAEVTRIISNPEVKEKMRKAAAEFARRDSALLIAQEIMQIAVSHDQK